MAIRMQQRRGTATQWTNANPVLGAGELGWESNTNKFKIGDGVNTWDDLPYFLDEDTLEGAVDDFIPLTQKGVANGVATLNASAKIPSEQLDIDELSQDAVNTALTAGTGITKTYNDNANTITVAVDTSTIAPLSGPTFTGTVTLPSTTSIGDVSATEIGYVNGVTSAIQTQLDGKAATAHTHAIGDVTNLQTTLDGKAASSHTHAQSDITNLTTDLAAKAPSASPTFTGTVVLPSTTSIGDVSATEIGYLNNVSSAIQTQLDEKAATSHSHAIADVTNLQTSLDGKLALAGGTMTGALTLAGAPSNALDAATKAYVDAVSEGLHIHPSVVAATTANVDISTALEPGDVIDGVTLAEGNRVLVKNQTNAAQNGIYVVQASGAALRASDFNEPQEVDGGDFVFVTGGTLYDNTGWVQTTTNVVTIGTDPIVFTQFSGAGTYQAGTGLTLTGNTFSINTATTVDTSTTQTLTNKTVDLGNNTVSGTLAQFNTAVTDADLASLATSQTLTNKTIALGSNTISGTTAQFNTALTDGDFATLAGSETLSNKTLTTPRFATAGEIDDANGAELIKFPATVASAVNEVTVSNAATGSAPSVAATGDDTNVSLNLVSKGTGTVQANGVAVATTTGTQTLTNKTIALGSNTISGTLAQFNTAVTDADLAPTDSPTFTGTVTLPSTTSIGSVSSTELGYLDGVTSALQTQLNGKAASSHTHAQSDITNLTTDLAAKAPSASPTFTGTVVLPSTTSIGDVSATEIGYLNNVSSAIQTQLDSKVSSASPSFTLPPSNASVITIHNGSMSQWENTGTEYFGDMYVSFVGQLPSIGDIVTYSNIPGQSFEIIDTNFQVLNQEDAEYWAPATHRLAVMHAISGNSALGNLGVWQYPFTMSYPGTNISSTEIGYLDGVTSAIQTQLSGKANTSDLAAKASLTGAETLTNKTLTNYNVTGQTKEDILTSATGFAGYTYNVMDDGVQYITANSTANGTINFRGNGSTTMNTFMATNQSVTCVLLVTNGASAFYPNAFQIDGNAITAKWQGGTAPTAGNANSIDAYTFTIIKTASATYQLLASQTRFA